MKSLTLSRGYLTIHIPFKAINSPHEWSFSDSYKVKRNSFWTSTTSTPYKKRCADRESTNDSKLHQLDHRCREVRRAMGIFWAHKQPKFQHQIIQLKYEIQKAAQNSS